MPEFAERQSGRGINSDAEGRVVSIPHVTVFGIGHPVAVKPSDTRPDIRGKAQHVHHVGCRPDKLRRDRRWPTHVSVRVTRRNDMARNVVRRDVQTATATTDRSKVERLT